MPRLSSWQPLWRLREKRDRRIGDAPSCQREDEEFGELASQAELAGSASTSWKARSNLL
jgi:hypothetical protein